jgi:hypothetical protein
MPAGHSARSDERIVRIRAARSRAVLPCLVACVLLVAAGCSERENAILDLGLVEDAVEGTDPRQITIETTRLDTYFQTTRQTTTQLWVGSQPTEGSRIDAKGLMRFVFTLPAETVVLGDTLRLVGVDGGDYGDPVAQRIAIERVTAQDTTWYESTSVGWPFTAHQQLSSDTTFLMEGVTEEDVVDVAMPLDVVQSWVDDPGSNHGLALIPRGGGGFKRFQVAGIELRMRYAFEGDTLFAAVPLASHASIYALDPEIEQGGTGDETVALVGGPYDFRAVLDFGLETLPPEAGFHRFELQLTLDAGAALAVGEEATLEIGFHRLVSVPGEDLGPRPAVGFFVNPLATATVPVNPAADERVVVDISAFGTEIDDGILVKLVQDYPSLSRIGIATREAAATEPDAPPALDVVFSLPPDGRF